MQYNLRIILGNLVRLQFVFHEHLLTCRLIIFRTSEIIHELNALELKEDSGDSHHTNISASRASSHLHVEYMQIVWHRGEVVCARGNFDLATSGGSKALPLLQNLLKDTPIINSSDSLYIPNGAGMLLFCNMLQAICRKL